MVDGSKTLANAGIGVNHPFLPGVVIPSYVGATNPDDDVWVDGVSSLANVSTLMNGGAGDPDWIEGGGGWLVANFSGTPTTCTAPLEVSFTDSSTGEITEKSWNFGDTSPANNERNPTHTYDASGIYTVSLTVTGPDGTDTETRTNYISVTTPIQYSLTVNTVGLGSVNTAGGIYDPGTEVQLTPVPDTGWAFNGWSGDLC